YSVDEPSPHGQRKPRKSHALRAQVDRGDGKIERAEKRSGAENRDGNDPKGDSRLRGNQECSGHADERNNRDPERKKVERGKGHFARADLQRKKIIAERSEERRVGRER